MSNILQHAAEDFLANRRVAVSGVSRKGDTAACGIHSVLKKHGYSVFIVNPNAESINGETSYASLKDIPGGVEAVVAAAPPAATAALVEECIRLKIRYVWMHRSFDTGSVDYQAVLKARAAGIHVIDGACPLMFLEPVDLAHRCFRWWMAFRKQLPVLE